MELVTLRTDERVHDVVVLFRGRPDVRVLREIDSASWGEGYDLEVLGIPVRLYDDVRSDEAAADPQFLGGRRSWDETLESVAERMRGGACVSLAVDYWDERPGDHTGVVERITRILVAGGYSPDRIGVERLDRPDGPNGRGRRL